MKKKWKRLSACVLAAAMIMSLAGCGKAEPQNGEMRSDTVEIDDIGAGEQAKGRYVEKQLSTPEGFSGSGNLSILADGTMVLFDVANGVKNISTDGGNSWEGAEDVKLFALINDPNNEITSTIAAPDGGIFMSYVNWKESTDDKKYPEKYYYRASDGTEKEFELGTDDYASSIAKAVFAKDGGLYAFYNNNVVYRIDLEKETAQKVLEPEGGTTLNMFAVNDTVAVVDGSSVYWIDTASQELLEEDPVLNEYIAKASTYPDTAVLCGDSSGKVYAASSGGIYAHVVGGSVMEQLAEGSLTNLSDPSKTPQTITIREDGSFIILYLDGEMDSYTFDPQASVVPEHQLTIYSLHENATVRQAVSSFRRENPDYYVRVDIGMTGEDGVTRSDAIQRLNTELLAGEGPDLLLLDDLPIDSYVEKGVLTDLSDVKEELLKEHSYFEGIWKAYQTDSKEQYALVVRYAVPVLEGRAEDIAQVDDLNALADVAEKIAAESTTEQTVLGSFTADALLRQLYIVSAQAWYEEDGSVNAAKITEFLTAAKRIYDAEQQNLDEQEKEEFLALTISSYDAPMNQFQEAGGTSGSFQLMNQLRGIQKLSAGWYEGMMPLQDLFTVCDQNAELNYRLFDGQQKNTFIPQGIVGMSVNAREPDIAKQFIRVLLGNEVQEKDLSDGYPVNQDAFAAYETNPYPEGSFAVGLDDIHGNEVSLSLVWPSQQNMEKFKAMIMQLDTPSAQNSDIEQEVISVGMQALMGEKEIEQCVEEISQKLSLQAQE